MRPLLRGIAVPATLVGLLATGCTHAKTRSSDITIGVSRSACGRQWSVAHGGDTTFQIHNGDIVGAEVYLVDPRSGGIYAEVEALAPGTTRPMTVALGRGSYAFRCVPDDNDVVTGPTVTVADGPQDAAKAVLPVTEQDLGDAVKQYRAYVTAGLDTLAADVQGLRQTLASGNLDAARTSWLTAHLAYERLGAAYGTFDDFADKIDGLPDGLPDGVHDKDFTGLRRLEYGLWHGEPLPDLATVAGQLVSDVDGLRQAFPKQQTDPNDLPLRAHEILENALQFELTGDADQGSGTSLATISANLAGTHEVLTALATVMRPRDTTWDQAGAWLTRTTALVDSFARPTGWTPLATLSADERRTLAGDLGNLVELLAPVAAIGDVRRTS